MRNTFFAIYLSLTPKEYIFMNKVYSNTAPEAGLQSNETNQQQNQTAKQSVVKKAFNFLFISDYEE